MRMTKHTCTLMHCDTIVRNILPPMRAEMVFRLVNNKGISQSDAAKRLGITRAAVSNYLSGKRGAGEVEISTELDSLIDRWAFAVVTGESEINLCEVCKCALKKF